MAVMTARSWQMEPRYLLPVRDDASKNDPWRTHRRTPIAESSRLRADGSPNGDTYAHAIHRLVRLAPPPVAHAYRTRDRAGGWRRHRRAADLRRRLSGAG